MAVLTSQRECGEKHLASASLKLLMLVQEKGLEADSLRRNEAWHEEDRKTRNPIPQLNRTPMAPRPAMRPICGAWRTFCGAAWMRSPNTSSRRFNVSDARLSTPGGYYVQPTVGHGAEVPPEARWAQLKTQAKQPTIGQQVDEAMVGAERDNPALDKQRLGQRSSPAPRARRAASSTPRVVLSSFLVQMLDPYQDRVYDPCCGSSGMFVQSVEFIRAHATGNGNGGKAPKGTRADISIWGQEYMSPTTRLGGSPR